MKQPMWDSKAVKAYETGQGVELVNEPYPHYAPIINQREEYDRKDQIRVGLEGRAQYPIERL